MRLAPFAVGLRQAIDGRTARQSNAVHRSNGRIPWADHRRAHRPSIHQIKRVKNPMATLSKNGRELARFDQLKTSYSIRSNGKVLRNEGFGWKVCTLKEGWTPETFRARLEEIESKVSESYRIYRAAVQSEFPLPVRWQYLTLSDLLGDDLDGIYSDLQDRQIYTDLDTLRELHDLHQTYRAEFEARKTGKVTA